MAYHLLLSVKFDIEAMQRGAEREENPRHILYGVSRRLNAEVHIPETSTSMIDRILANVAGEPAHWARARKLASTLNNSDVVFCAGDDSGLPLVLTCLAHRCRPKIIIWVMAPERKRLHVLFRLLRNYIDVFIVNTEYKKETILRNTGCPPERVLIWPEQTDTEFFTPGEKRPRSRPLIFSAGREQRDYRTLAQATQNLNVDVEVCALSPNATDSTPGTFPDPVPPNMTFHPYPWPEFRQAYRDADLVVVSLLENNYSAGATTLLEAMACRRPVIVTNISGPARDFIQGGCVVGVEPGDVAGLRRAIEDVLAHPVEAAARADRAFDRIQRKHSALVVREYLIEKMMALNPELPNKAP
jgi:glycosyltransferase involved in cell wall biosynthesis